jgi:hypothetical protein
MSQFNIPEVNVCDKKQKYKRYVHEKRAKRTPGVKKIQSPYIMVTKWDVEIANKRNKKIGRNRDRVDKYGVWNENQTDTLHEDDINRNQYEQLQERLKEQRKQLRREHIHRVFAEYDELVNPTYKLANKDSWPMDVLESYHEYLELESDDE